MYTTFMSKHKRFKPDLIVLIVSLIVTLQMYRIITVIFIQIQHVKSNTKLFTDTKVFVFDLHYTFEMRNI